MNASYDIWANLIAVDKTERGTKSASRNFDRLGKSSDTLGQKFAHMGKSAASNMASIAKYGAIAAAGLGVAFGVKSVRAASDLTESINAVEVTFGEAAAGIKELGEESVRTVGLSRSQFNSLAVQFSNFAQTVAGPTGDVADVMDDLTTRVADFASVMNLDVAEAATLFQSGLAGETEPLRRYGIDLSAAAVEAHALKVGISDGTGELTEQQKVMARYSLVMEQTSKTAGDFANTQGSLANQTRIAKGNFENLAASAGQALLPIGEAIMPKVNAAMEDLGAWFDANMPAIQATTAEWGRSLGELIDRIEENFPDIKQSFEDVAAAVKEEWPDIKDTFDNVASALERVGGFLNATWEAFRSLPPEVQQVLALLAVAQKTGVISVAFKGAELVKGLVSNINAGVVNVNGPVGGAGGKLPAAGKAASGGAVAGGLLAGGVVAGATAGAIGAARGSARAGEQGANRGFITGAPVPGAGGMWVDQSPMSGSVDSMERELRAETDRVKSRASWMPSWLYGIVWGEPKPGADYKPEPQGIWTPKVEGADAAREEISKVNRAAADGSKSLDGLDAATDRASEGMWGLSQDSSEAGSSVSFNFGDMASNVGTTVSNMVGNVGDWFSQMGSNIAAGVSATVTVVGMWFGQMASDVGAKAEEIWTNVTDWFTQTKDSALAKVQELWDGAKQKFEDLKTDVSRKAEEIWGNVTGWFDGLATRSGEIWQGIVDNVGEIWGGIEDKVRGPVNELFKWLNRNLIEKLNGVITNFNADLEIGLLPTFHSGGFTGDQMYSREGLALLRNDEFVLNPQATREHRDLAEALNSGKGREYLEDVARAGAMGYGVGPVGPIGDLISRGMSALADVLSRGARAAVDFVANPALDLLQRTFGGNWPVDLTIGWARKAVDAAKDWATGQDAAAGSGYSGPIQVGNFVRPANGVVTSEYGPRWGAFHAGIDIGAPMGAAIRAIADGKAVSTTGMGWNGGYGNMVTLDHGDGFSTRYAHASALAVGIGQIVKAGQQIAAIGSTGDSTGPHLHFETRRNGISVNPRSVMTFDQGGYLPPGMSVVENLTGKPEPVLNPQQWDALTSQRVVLEIDGRVLHESLLRYKRSQGGASLGLA